MDENGRYKLGESLGTVKIVSADGKESKRGELIITVARQIFGSEPGTEYDCVIRVFVSEAESKGQSGTY